MNDINLLEAILSNIDVDLKKEISKVNEILKTRAIVQDKLTEVLSK